MTTTLIPQEQRLSQETPTVASRVDTRPPSTQRPAQSREVVWVTSALLVFGMMLLTFVLEVTVVGAVRHARIQSVEYQQLRSDLALATAPIGQLDSNGQPVELGRPVALLEIPSIGLREVVDEGTTSAVLQNGPGHLRSSAFPGQSGTSVIMGRQASYGGPFRRVASLKAGAEIQVVTGQGTSTYQVSGMRHSGDKAIAKLGTLTLVTGDGTQFAPSGAVWVDATLTSKPFDAPATVFGPNAFGDNEKPMTSDTSHVLQLFLWAQALLLSSLLIVWVRSRWARPQTWLVALPLLAVCGLQVSHYLAQFLPNLL